MAVIEAQSGQLETWSNAGRSRVALNRWDDRGNRRQELIGGGRTFHISPAERRMNQEMAANESLDHFSNGIFQPVRLVEGSPESEIIAGNPNHVSGDELAGIYKLHWKTFEKRVAEISNPLTLERLLEVAADQDATVRQVKVIEARLEEVVPRPVERDAPDSGGGPIPGMPVIKPVTPR